jgi:hypothetical protein
VCGSTDEPARAESKAGAMIRRDARARRVPTDAAPPFRYRAQLQPAPHWQVSPQRHPGRRVSVFFLDI